MDTETRQALAELLLLAPYLDQRLSTLEDEALERAMVSIGWNPHKLGDVSLTTALGRVREAAASEPSTDAFLRERAAVVKAAGQSDAAFSWLGRILGADGMSGEENHFLLRMQALLF